MTTPTTPHATTTTNSTTFKSHPSNFSILSADGVRFPVQKVVLIANSPVFADTLSIPQEPLHKAEMKLPESTATLLDSFLRFLHRGPNPQGLDYTSLRALFDMCEKYDVESLFPALAGALYFHAAEKPMEVWAILSIHHQDALAKECLRHMDFKKAPDNDNDGYGRYATPRYSPSDIPPALLELIPGKALNRLLVAYDKVVQGRSTWNAVYGQF